MSMPRAYDYELVDPLGNRLTVEPLNSRTVIVRIVQDDGGVDGTLPPQDAHVLATLEEIQALARAVASRER